MRLQLKTAPTVEPITLAEAKNHLKVDSSEDNVLIGALVTTARELTEIETKRALITQTWRLFLDSAPAVIEIPKPPLQSVVSIKAISSVNSIVDQNSNSGQAILSITATSGFAAADLAIIGRDGEREEELVILSVQDDESLTFTENLSDTHTAAQADRVEKYTLVVKTKYHVDRSENSPGRVSLQSGQLWPIHRGFASFIIEFIAGHGDAATDVPAILKQAMLQLLSYLYENREADKIPEGLKSLFWSKKILRI